MTQFFELSVSLTAFLFDYWGIQFISSFSKVREQLMAGDSNITSFNIGSNDGAEAGQTVMHCHIHLIPRRKNDTSDPRGGIRGVIPEKQKY